MTPTSAEPTRLLRASFWPPNEDAARSRTRRPRSPALPALLVLLAFAVLPAGCSPAAEPAGAPDLRAHFGAQADRVIGRGLSPVRSGEGYWIGDVAAAEDGSSAATSALAMRLPERGEDEIRIETKTGFSATVREEGVRGRATSIDHAIHYPRARGSAYWSASGGDCEEWLHFAPGALDDRVPAAIWTIGGAAPKLAGDAVELLDETGLPQVRITAPEAFAAGGEPVSARLRVDGSRVELWVDSGGREVLVDPVWKSAWSMLAARGYHTATRLLDGRVLVAGGYASNGPSTEIYDPSTGSWSPAAPMLTWRAQHRATLLADGRVLVTGSDSDLDSAEVYNPASNTWSPAGHMGVMRYGHCSVRLPSGKVLVLGGITPSFHPNAALAELYDPATNTWSSAGFTTGMKRSCDAVLLNDGRALVVGGSPPGAWMPAGDGLPQTIEIYSPSTNTWSPAAPMLKPRVGGTVTKLANGKVLVVGGIDAAPFWPDEIIALSDAELYDPQSDTWSAAGAMHAPSADHTATLLGNGHVLVITDAWQRSQPAEQYDPQSNTWSPAGSLLHSRAALFSFGPSHAAVSLAGGAALVTGGFGDQVWGFLSDAALVDPGCAVNVAFQMSHEPGACPVSGAPFCNAFCGGLGCGVKYDLPVCESQPAWGSPPVTELSYTEYCGCSSTSPIPPPPPPHACPPPRQSVGPERAGLACPGGGDPDPASFAQDCSVYCSMFGSGGAGCQAHDKATCSSDPALGAHHWTDLCLCVGCRSGFSGPACATPPPFCPCGNLVDRLTSAELDNGGFFPAQCAYDPLAVYVRAPGFMGYLDAKAGYAPETDQYYCETAAQCDIPCTYERLIITAEQAAACQQQLRAFGGPICAQGAVPSSIDNGCEPPEGHNFCY